MTNSLRARRTAQTILSCLSYLTLLAGCGLLPPLGSTSDVAAVALTKCGDVSSLALVIGVHQNMTKPGVPAEVGCLLTAAVSSRANIAVIALDGAPHFALPSTVFPLIDEKINPVAHDDDAEAARRIVVAAATMATASSDGSDLMTGLSLAATVRQGSHPVVIVIDSVLPDTGSVRLTDPGMTAADPKDVVATLKQANDLPNLKGTNVTVIGAGWTASPQHILTEAQRRNVTDIMSAIISAAGGWPHMSPTARTGAGPLTPFTTKTVTASMEPTFSRPSARTLTPAAMVFNQTTVVRFGMDSADLTDPASVAKVLAPAASWLKSSANNRVTVTGRTSSGNTTWPSREALGKARANAIAAVLVHLGVPSAQVRTSGAGYTANPPDGGANHLDAGRAALNRAVDLTFAQS